ncbi:MAG: nuclear transport factor 2 family protein [Bryobacteraceae bacterium]
MNEQQNVALVKKAFEAFGRGDVQAILDFSSNDSELYFPGPDVIPYAGRKRGRSEMQTFFDSLITTQKNVNLSIDQFVAQDNAVVAIGRYTGQVKSTGKSIDTPVVLAFHIEGGKITRHLLMSDTAAIASSYTAAAAAAQ